MFTAFCLASKGWGICRQQLLAAEKICIGLLAIFITTSMIYGDLASVSTVFSSLVLLIVFYQFIIDNITNAIADLSSYIADVTSNQERQWRIADRQAVVKTIRDSAALERSIKASFVKGTINFSPDSGSGIPSNTNNPEKAIAENISNNKTETLFDKMDPEERYIEYHNNNLSLLHQLWNLFVLYAGLAFIVSTTKRPIQ
jgi:hypothetical protein